MEFLYGDFEGDLFRDFYGDFKIWDLDGGFK